MSSIPFNRPALLGNEMEYVRQAVAAGQISGDGTFTRKASALLERLIGVPKTLLTTSCTHALEMAALLLDAAPGAEVIMPSFTFVSCANAFVLRGARPVFADVRPDTLNLDELRLERLITSRTRAILAVHYAGIGCDMDAILEIARRHGIPVVEDNAHGLLGTYRGRPLGSFGDLSTLSFHETKNFTCGEGGALIINRPEHIERAEILREKGTDRSRFFRGEVDKYSWVDLGSSYLPSDMLAAFLYAQLEERERIQTKREALWRFYMDRLRGWAREHAVQLPVTPPECGPAFHLFYLLLPSAADRDALIAHLRAAGIHAVFHYLPLHLSEMGRSFGGRPGDCPVTESVSSRLLRLPMYYDLTVEEQERIVRAMESFANWSGAYCAASFSR